MRKLLTVTCCVGLASLVGAAQHDEDNPKPKKGGNNGPQQQQVVTQQTGKHYKTGQGNGPHYNAQNFHQPNTLGPHYKNTGKNKWNGPAQGNNVNSSANNTTFDKSKTVNKTVNKNYQFKQYNVSKNANYKYKQVQFNQNYHIAGAHNWHGAKYQVFVNYQPVWHDQWWWHEHYHNNVVFILGGWYFWNAGYWYPAWGYDPGSVYYYDGPIYASNPAQDPGQVVANVQSALQDQGFYQGDIDGILGPQTRAALAEYQSAQGLEPTGAVDEPTLETLGMA